MPGEKSPEVPQPQTLTSESVVNVTSPKPKKDKKFILILAALLLLGVLAAVGYWFFVMNTGGNKGSSDSDKEATSSSKAAAPGEEQKQTINKVGFVDQNNIWILDAVSKKTVQITKDATSEIYYQNPLFLDDKTFVYVKRLASGSELWRGEFSGEQVSLEQNKKFKSQIYLFDITADGKTMVFSSDVGERKKVYIYDLATDKETVIYDKEWLGRGASSEDAFYGRISPDGSKVLLVDTFFSENEKISVWDLVGKKVVGISGSVTHPIWIGNSKSIVYKEIEVGIHQYDLVSQSDQKIISEKDWTALALSPDGKRFAHNKGLTANEGGMSNSSVGVFDLVKKTDSNLGDGLASPRWVNDDYLIMNKLRKCNAEECAADDPASYTTEKVIVVYNLSNGKKDEIQTENIPLF